MKYWLLLTTWLRKLASGHIATRPTVSAADLAAAPTDAEYLHVLVEAYERLASPDPPQARLHTFSNEAAVLLLFSSLRGQVENGGFIQLIQNGYGEPIFDSPFTQDLAGWGAAALAALTEQAAATYRAHRAYLERQRSIPEFSALYTEFREFEPLENQFYDVLDDQTARVRAYVAQHLSQFAHVSS